MPRSREDPKGLVPPGGIHAAGGFAPENIVGYTQGNNGTAPSVYYKHGHMTLQHDRWYNIGWEGEIGWECVFFGNVAKGHWKKALDVQSAGHPARLGLLTNLINLAKQESDEVQVFCLNGSWLEGPVGDGKNVHALVEIWDRHTSKPQNSRSRLLVHPSRNLFKPATSPGQRLELHTRSTTAPTNYRRMVRVAQERSFLHQEIQRRRPPFGGRG